MKKLSERAWNALGEALRTYHWYKADFENMVRARFVDAPEILATLDFSRTKREAVGQLLAALRSREQRYQGLVIDALVGLADVDPNFERLARLEDGDILVKQARSALAEVRYVTEQYSELAAQRESVAREAERAKAEAEGRRLHERKLTELKEQFLGLHASQDPQARGREFEGFLNELFQVWDLDPRASYSVESEQIDGAFTFRTDDYLLEARWWKELLQPKHLNDFRAKVDGKAANTLGLCVAVAGFTDGAVMKHSQPQTPLILMDGTDLMPILEDHIGLDEVLLRKRRHAVETGIVMFRASP